MAKAYTVISTALTSAIQIGLHRNLPIKTDLIEVESRKRLFWAIRKLESYTGSMLGLPGSLRNDDIDQTLPADADDEFITEDSILPLPPGEISLMAAANQHTKMFIILTEILEVIRPAQSTRASARRERLEYVVSNREVASLEQQLQKWRDELPQGFRPGIAAAPNIRVERYVVSEPRLDNYADWKDYNTT